MHTPATLADLSARLTRVERQNRALLTIAVALSAVAVVAAGSEPQTPKRIDAESFVLRDSAGLPRATLATLDNGGAAVMFFDKNKNVRVICGVNATGVPSIQFNDQTETGRAVLGLDDASAPGLDLSDRAGHRRVRLNIADIKGEQPAALNFSDAGGTPTVSLVYSEKLYGFILSDHQSRMRAAFVAGADGTPTAFIQNGAQPQQPLWAVP